MKPRQFLRRIRTIERIEKITKAMEIVASTQLRKLGGRFENASYFLNEFNQILAQIYISYRNQPNKWWRPKADRNYLLIIIGSDRGLCGAFNINLLQEVKFLISDLEAKGKKVVEIIPLGKKCTAYCRRVYKNEGLVDYDNKEEEFAKMLAEKVIASYIEEKIDVILLISNLYKKSSLKKVGREKILPLEFEMENIQTHDWIIEPDWEQFLNRIMPGYLKYRFYLKILESRLSEELARMLAMKYATENAEEMIEKLTLKYHRMRQAEITRELLEITQAAEALNE